jgi:hypothetical protein
MGASRTGDEKEDLPIAQRLNTVVQDACELLSLIDGTASRGVALNPGIGSVARIISARDAARALVEELQIETERRMQLGRAILSWTMTVVGCGDFSHLSVPIAICAVRSPASRTAFHISTDKIGSS